MFKKSVLLVLALGLVLSTSLSAQEVPQYTITAPSGTVVQMPADFKHDFKDATGLSQTELEALVAENQCGDNLNAPTFCVGWSGAFCTGVGVVNPCGFFTNGVFGSVSTGCTRTFVSPNPNLAAPVTQFVGFPDNTCITPTSGVLRSFACVTP